MLTASPSLLVPIGAGFGYAVAALMLKRGTEGAGPWRVAIATNCVMAALFTLAWLLPPQHPTTLRHVGHAMLAGGLFFIGQVFTFLALSRGDVSVATPVLGSKVIFVAIFTALLGLELVNGTTWIAVLLTAAATALLGWGPVGASRQTLFRGIFYGFCAAAVFALTDLAQQRWVREWSFFHFVSTMFFTVAVLSIGLVPLVRGDGRKVSAASWGWTFAGGSVIAVQASSITWSILALGATTTNVLYNSRGLWSVLLVWSVGHWFGNEERGRGRAVMLRRLAGSLLLLTAIFLITGR